MDTQRGAVTVMVALSIVAVIAFLAFVVNVAYLYYEKSRLQNSVEAAAMAAVAVLATGDPDGTARLTAQENGVPSDAAFDTAQFAVTAGTFSENNGVFSEGESDTNNAVRVTLNSLKRPLLFPWIGFGDEGCISASATAYLESWGMVSLSESGSIRLARGLFRNGSIFAAGDIQIAGPPWRPVFDNVRFFARGSIVQSPVTYLWGLPTGVNWNTGSTVDLEGGHAETSRMIDVRPVNNRYIESLRSTADVVYTPDQAGSDNVFYGRTNAGVYFVDLSEVRDSRQVIFFDGSGTSGTVKLLPKEDTSGTQYSFPPHTPISNRVENVTFITDLSVYVADGAGWGTQNEYHLGACGSKQVIVITSGNVQFYPAGMNIDGIVFRCGGKLEAQGTHSSEYPTSPINIRAICDGTIDWIVGQTRPVDPMFSAPSPPSIIKLVTP